MNKQFKILLATDLSNASLNAEKYAFKLAQETNSFLLVMHVYDSAGEMTNCTVEEKIRRLHKHVFMHTISGSLMTEPVNYECLIREGVASKQIAREARDLDVDFIIMGCTGENETSATLGTQTRDLILNGDIPVVSIPSDATYNGIHRVTFVTNNRDGELPVINHLSKFCRALNADLSILHLAPAELSPEFAKRSQQQFLTEIKRKISYPNIKLETCHLNDLQTGLETYCIENKTDMIVMSPERPAVFDKLYVSSKERVSFLQNKIPLFTIPDFYSPDYSWFWRSLVPEHSHRD